MTENGFIFSLAIGIVPHVVTSDLQVTLVKILKGFDYFVEAVIALKQGE